MKHVRIHSQGFTLTNVRAGVNANGKWIERFGRIGKLDRRNKFLLSVSQMRVYFGDTGTSPQNSGRLVIARGLNPSLGQTHYSQLNLGDTYQNQKPEWVVALLQPDLSLGTGSTQHINQQVDTQQEIILDEIPDGNIEFNLIDNRDEEVKSVGAGWDIFLLLKIVEFRDEHE